MTCGYKRTKGTRSNCRRGRGLFIAAAVILSIVMLRARAEHGTVVELQSAAATPSGAAPESTRADRMRDRFRQAHPATSNLRLAEISSDQDLLGDVYDQVVHVA